MAFTNNINVLIADNNEDDRQRIAEVLRTQGYNIIQAIDGGSAMKVVDERGIDIAIITDKMTPRSGTDFARHVLERRLSIGIVMLTDNSTTDLLLEAGKLEIKQVMRKPVDLGRLGETVRRVLRAYGKNPAALGYTGDPRYTPDDLMKRALALAQQNSRSRMGGPFGAVVSDAEGRILGEGVNSVSALCDPTAHAEVLAIRRATDRLNKTDLSGCVVYCSSQPTMLGQALIISTGVAKVYYGLSHNEVGATRINEEGILGEIAKPLAQRTVPYEQLQHAEALAQYKAWQAQKERISN